MKKAFLRGIYGVGISAIGLICGYNLYQRCFKKHQVVQVSSQPENKYDMHYKDVKKFKYFDRRKIKCNFKSRDQHINELRNPSEDLDLLIIGGGRNSASIALDAATRGLSCAVISKSDFGADASCKPFLYLEGGFGKSERLSRNEVTERCFFHRFAPYLCVTRNIGLTYRSISSLLPNYGKILIDSILLKGQMLFISHPRPVCFPEIILWNEPVLCYPQKEINKIRFVTQALLTASLECYIGGMKGTALGNYIEVKSFIQDKAGKCIGVKVTDLVTEKKFEIRAKAIVNCSEHLVDQIDNPAGIKSKAPGNNYGHATSSLKYLHIEDSFLLPGTAIRPEGKNLIPNFKEISISDKEFLYTGRCKEKDDLTLKVSKSGVLSALGGKWENFFQIGEATVNEVLKLNTNLAPLYNGSVVKTIRLIGSYTTASFDGTEKESGDFINTYLAHLTSPQKYSIDYSTALGLISLYGAHSIQVAELGHELNMNTRIHPELPITQAQIIYSARNEMVVHINDLILRRLGNYITDPKIISDLIPQIGVLIAKEQKWTHKKLRKEVKLAQQEISEVNNQLK